MPDSNKKNNSLDHHNYIIFQCYGNEGVFQECAFALLSLTRSFALQQPDNLQIWIYTDNPDWFRAFVDCQLPLHYRYIDAATITEWKGKIDFVHRVKIEILKDFTRDRQGNILYLDADVCITHPLTQLFAGIDAGKLYMHVMESVVSQRANPILSKLDTYLRAETTITINQKPIYDLEMWNAGVLGFNTKYRHLLDEVLTFTDCEYPKFSKHIIEQFAFSIFFQQEGQVKSAAPYMLHYWNLKEARAVLADFFAYFSGMPWPKLAGYAVLLQMHVLMQEKVNYLANRSIADKLQGKQWTPPTIDWKRLATEI